MNSRRDELNHSASRTLAASVGSMPVAIAIGIALTLALPLSANVRLTVGSYAVFPVWVTVACFAFLAPNARRAWLLLLTALVLAAFTSLVAIVLGRGTPPTWSGR